MNTDQTLAYIAGLIASFFASWQVRSIAGLIVLDLILGIARALKAGEFDWRKVADFYRTAVAPYIIGYLGLDLVIQFMVPPSAGLLNDGLTTLAWGTLTASLLASIGDKLTALYQGQGNPSPPATFVKH